MELYELELGIVDGLGLDEFETDATLELVQAHVGSAAERLRGIHRDTDESGLTDNEWWYSVLPTLTQVLADRHYPLSARVGSAVGAERRIWKPSICCASAWNASSTDSRR